MIFDAIVFTQEELENALYAGYTSVGLCDNTFNLPIHGGISYTAIGNVTASINLPKKDFARLDIKCDGFIPKFIHGGETAIPASPLASHTTSSSSYVSSYMLSSYITSYIYEYQYEYGSFSSSYTSSYSSGMSSFVTSFRLEYGNTCILVNGYGINLI